MEKPGNQSRHDGEPYAEWMSRLYKPAHYTEDRHNGERPRWSFRVPNDLAAEAFSFMKEHKMSITTYLTFAMHNHLNNKTTNK
jgi:hypothetical protein